MRATKVKGGMLCPLCDEVVDPDEHGLPEEQETWRCPSCEVISAEGPSEVASCTHPEPEVVMEQCPECEVWNPPEAWVTRKLCPLCEEWVDPDDADFDEEIDPYKCGECDTIHQDREDAKECCR